MVVVDRKESDSGTVVSVVVERHRSRYPLKK